jgi:hypothetical protein
MERFFDLNLSPAAATLNIKDILDENRLIRLHPHWFIDNAKQRDSGLFAELHDYATEQVFTLGVQLGTISAPDDPEGAEIIMRITLFDYPVTELLLYVRQDKSRVRVRYVDAQPGDDLEADILLWISSIQEYLRMYTTTTPRTLFFRLLMNRMILQMNPSQRKICIMITKITIIELLVILILVVGYVYFT